MKQESLHSIFNKRYPNLSNVEASAADGAVTIRIYFKNPIYYAWIFEQRQGIVVGLNFLHQHYDYFEDSERMECLEDAFAYLDEILTGKIVALREKDSEPGFVRALSTAEDAITYCGENADFEWVGYEGYMK